MIAEKCRGGVSSYHASEVDEIVCVFTPEPFDAVGLWYETFSQTTDEEIQELLTRAAEEQGTTVPRWMAWNNLHFSPEEFRSPQDRTNSRYFQRNRACCAIEI